MCYQCSKDVWDLLFDKLRIRYSRDEPQFPVKWKLLSSQIQINTFFKNNDERIRRVCDRNIHKAVKIPVNVYQTNENLFVKVQPKIYI